jgi:plastocyanin
MASFSQRLHSANFLIPFLVTVFIDAWYIAASIFFLVTTSQLPFFVYFWLPFIVLLPVAAIVTYKRPRVGYIFYAILGILGLTFFSDGGHGVEIWSTSSNTAQFFDTITTIPLYAAILIYALLGVRETWPKTKPATAIPMTIPRTTVIGLVILGFVVGGLTVGLLAGTTESRLISNAGTQADIVIVHGAGLQSNGQFYTPINFTVKAGTPVTWVNRDNTVHTVTSTTALFDSKDIAAGATYTHTFNTPGTYPYYCTYHTWMKGSIIVTS